LLLSVVVVLLPLNHFTDKCLQSVTLALVEVDVMNVDDMLIDDDVAIVNSSDAASECNSSAFAAAVCRLISPFSMFFPSLCVRSYVVARRD